MNYLHFGKYFFFDVLGGFFGITIIKLRVTRYITHIKEEISGAEIPI